MLQCIYGGGVILEQFRICKDCDFSGVYAIVNISKQKIYIGSSKNIKKRLEMHKTSLKHGKHHVARMQEAYNRGDKFIAYVVTRVRIREEKNFENDDLRYFEGLAIKQFKALDYRHGYNSNVSYSQLMEEQNIIYAKRNLDFYFNMFDSSFPISKQGREVEKKKFINKVLNIG